MLHVRVNCRKKREETILFEQHMDVTSTNLSQNHPEKGFGAQDHPPKKRFTRIRSEGSCQRPLWLWFWMPRDSKQHKCIHNTKLSLPLFLEIQFKCMCIAWLELD